MEKKSIYRIIAVLLITGIGLFFFLNNRERSVTLVDYSSDPRCQTQNAKYRDPSVPVAERVSDLMSRMTELEKIGQMVIIEKNSVRDINDISRYNIGALLSGGGAVPKPNTPSAWVDMVGSFQSAAKNSCLGIPLLYGIDAIHGHANVMGATIFPHAIGLGATRNPKLVEQVAQATADEMAATGIYWSFSPNLDVPQDSRWGKTYETFGSDPVNVAQLGAAFLAGTQNSAGNYFNVLATAKHFIGGGAMEYGTSRNKDFKVEEGNITADEKTLRQIHLAPFKKAVAGGVQAVMVGTADWNGVINPSNRYLLTDVLKKELGFSGFVVSDWYAVYLVSPSRYEALVTAVNAGVDMVMTPFEYKDFTTNMQKALSSREIPPERIDDAVKRILTAKFKLGLFDRPAPTTEGLSVIGSPAHRDLARTAVRQSQVLLKNSNNSLPLSKSANRILVAGSGADNLGRQSGGWTIEWQGIDGNWIPGTTILQGIKNTVSKNTEVEYNLAGDFAPNANLADVAIAVVSEKPYAEGWGDAENPSLSAEDINTIQKLKTRSKKLIVVIVSGRPLETAPYINNWDAAVAAWLPGSEGQGVADVLFGSFPFTGKLPLEWK